MDPFLLTHFDPACGKPVTCPLPLDKAGSVCRVSLQPVQGASAMQIRVTGNGVSVRAETALASEENRVEWIIEWLQSGKLRIDSAQPMLFLPGRTEYEPENPLPGRCNGTLDLLFLLDATCRTAASGQASYRLSQPDAAGLYSLLIEFARQLAAAHSPSSTRFGFLAFADAPLPEHASALDLRPGPLLQPASFEGHLPYTTTEDLMKGFQGLQASSGVDWVDALAEALARCRQWAGWRSDARKLLVVCGDSPGHSVLHPAEQGCDAHSRTATVEEESRCLHQQGVEIATLFTAHLRDAIPPALRNIVEHARMQYRRLASLSAWAWDEQTFAQRAVTSLRSPPRWLARGPAYGTDPQQTTDGP
jgi:hypothetical protein